MVSPELRLLIESCKAFLSEGKNCQINDILSNEAIDWDKLQKMVGYHSIRPILHEALKYDKTFYTDAPQLFFNRLQCTIIKKTIQQQQITEELKQILLLLEKHSIPVFPYKGAILSSIIYSSNNLREWSDLDLFVPRNFAVAALKTLIADGYFFDQEKINIEYLTDNNTLENILSIPGWHEIGLYKYMGDNLSIHLDFHWQLCEDFYPYIINENEIINEARKIIFVDSNVTVPSIEHTIIMTILHHGGRESWMRLKHVCDLALFLKLYPDNLFWIKIISLSQTAKLKRSLILGCVLVQNHFSVQLPSIVESEIKEYNKLSIRYILTSWENSISFWESMKAQLIHKFILLNHQDDGFSHLRYWMKYLQFYTTPNPLEQPRLFTFDEKYKVANFFSKVITYLWKKGLK